MCSLEDHLRAIRQCTVSQLQSCDVTLVDSVKELLQEANKDHEPSGEQALYKKIQECRAKGSSLSKTGEFSALEAKSAIRSGLDPASPFDPRVEDVERICRRRRSCHDFLRFYLDSLIWLENFQDFTPSLRPNRRGGGKERAGQDWYKKTVKEFAKVRKVKEKPASCAIYYGRKVATFVEAYGDIGILVELTQTFSHWRRLEDADLRQCARRCRVGRTFAEAKSRTTFMVECEKEYALLFRERRTENVNWLFVPRRRLCADAFSLEKIKAGIQADIDAVSQLTPGSSSTEQGSQEATAPPQHLSPNADTNADTNIWSEFNTNLLPDLFYPNDTGTNSFPDFNTNLLDDLLTH